MRGTGGFYSGNKSRPPFRLLVPGPGPPALVAQEVRGGDPGGWGRVVLGQLELAGRGDPDLQEIALAATVLLVSEVDGANEAGAGARGPAVRLEGRDAAGRAGRRAGYGGSSIPGDDGV